MVGSARELELQYKTMAGVLLQAIKVVQAAEDSNIITTRHALTSLISQIDCVASHINAGVYENDSWAHLCSKASDKAIGVYSEYTRSVGCYAALIREGVKRLQELEQVSKLTSDQANEFNLVWEILNEAASVQTEWPVDWRPLDPPVKAKILTALDNLVAWQLAFIRGSSNALACMQQAFSFEDMLAHILKSVNGAMMEIDHLSILQGSTLRLALSEFPPAFLENLCSYVVEGMGPGVTRRASPPASTSAEERFELRQLPFSGLFGTLVGVIGCSILDLDSTGEGRDVTDEVARRHLCPAFFEVAKLTLLVSQSGFSSTEAASEDEEESRAMGLGCALNVMQRTLQLGIRTGANPRSAIVRLTYSSLGSGHSSSGGNSSAPIARSNISDVDHVHRLVLDALKEFVEEYPDLARSVTRLLVASKAADAELSESTSLPCLLSTLLRTARHADAWVCLLLPPRKLTRSRPEQQKLRLMMQDGSVDMAEARTLMVELAPLLQTKLSSGETMCIE